MTVDDRSKIQPGIKPEVLEEAKKYGTVVQGRYAGDGMYRPEHGGTMILTKCDWCGYKYNFRRKGNRICTPCWRARAKIRALEEQLGGNLPMKRSSSWSKDTILGPTYDPNSPRGTHQTLFAPFPCMFLFP